MSVRTGCDNYCANGWITYGSLGVDSFSAVLSREFSRFGRKDIYNISERHARLSSQMLA